MKGAEAAEVVGDLASQQWGLVTTAQATACGVDLQSSAAFGRARGSHPRQARGLCHHRDFSLCGP
ncbi:hypothetical protein ACUY22_11015 [Corynebacterium tuberculostearicum]